MRFISIFLLLLTIVNGQNTKETAKTLQEKNIQKQIEKEKKFKKEQKFYQGSDYDLKSFEIDEKSLDNIPKQDDMNKDFNMDSVYD